MDDIKMELKETQGLKMWSGFDPFMTGSSCRLRKYLDQLIVFQLLMNSAPWSELVSYGKEYVHEKCKLFYKENFVTHTAAMAVKSTRLKCTCNTDRRNKKYTENFVDKFL